MQEQGSEAGVDTFDWAASFITFFEELELEEFLKCFMKQIDHELGRITKIRPAMRACSYCVLVCIGM